jgi:AAA domain-containing protein
MIANQNGKFNLDDLAKSKNIPSDYLQNRWGLRERPDGLIEIPYFDEAGNEVYPRTRNPPGVEPRFRQKKGTKLRPYGEHRLQEAAHEGRLFMCEGESDTWTASYCDLPAVGIPGASAANSLKAEHLENIDNLYLLPDNDAAGEQLVDGVNKRLSQLGYAGRLWRVKIPDKYKDVSEWYVAIGKEAFEQELAMAVSQAELLAIEPRRPAAKPTSGAQLNGHAEQPRIRQLMIRNFAKIQPQKTRWLWRAYIPLGTLTILDGDPGLGKSTICIDLIARVTRGQSMPNDGETDLDGPAVALILSAEDAPENTIRPRLDAAGADVNLVENIEATKVGEDGERPPVLPADVDLLEEKIAETNAKLVVIDVFTAYLDGELDAHRDQDVRRCLHRLKILAQRTGCAIILIRHLNKLNGGAAIYRGGGSIGITGAARSVLMVGKNPTEPTQFVLAPIKCNLCKPPPALTYSIMNAGDDVSVIGWGQETSLSADDLLGCQSQKGTVAEECAALIRDLLADGPKLSDDMEDELKANGYKDNAIRDGRKKAKVRAFKKGFGEASKWWWELQKDKGDDAQDESVRVPPGW